jgi:hypothetical protein
VTARRKLFTPFSFPGGSAAAAAAKERPFCSAIAYGEKV